MSINSLFPPSLVIIIKRGLTVELNQESLGNNGACEFKCKKRRKKKKNCRAQITDNRGRTMQFSPWVNTFDLCLDKGPTKWSGGGGQRLRRLFNEMEIFNQAQVICISFLIIHKRQRRMAEIDDTTFNGGHG